MRLSKLTLSLLFSTIATLAAALTDSQVQQMAMQEYKKGKSQTEIATTLLKAGATTSQLQKMRSQYKNSQTLGNTSAAQSTVNRSRTATADNATTQRVQGDQLSAADINRASNMLEPRLKTPKDSLAYLRRVLEDKKAKKVFGHNIFRNESLTFEPNMNVAAPAGYQLGAGDQLIIDIYGASQKTMECEVSPEGRIVVEGFGPISVSGMTLEQANKRIGNLLGERFASSQISVTLGTTRSIVVNVMGEVAMPGTYTLSAFASVFNALYMAGGVNNIGSMRKVSVYRNNKLESEIDVYDYILNGQMEGDIKLSDNDVIIVGSYENLVAITGKVRRPMYYEMKKDETVATLLQYAGGFAGDAYTQSVRLIRKTGREFSAYNLSEDQWSTFALADGDSLSVDSVLSRYTNTVELKGSVFRPGMYSINEKVHSVRTLLDFAEGVTEEAFTARAVMHRMKEDRTLEVLAIDLEKVMSGSAADIELRENDVLFVPTKHEVHADRILTIHGEVMFPGVYRFADNTSVEDLVLQAGGLTDAATTVKIDVARRIVNPQTLESDSTAVEVFSIALKEDFKVDGDAGFVLQPFDEVYVRRSPVYMEQKNVQVVGEVMFPGVYTLSQKEQSLSSLMNICGGTTDFAYAKGACIIRRITQFDQRQLKKINKYIKKNEIDAKTLATLTKQQIANLQIEEEHDYQLAINLEKAIKNPGSVYDIALKEGDIVMVPTVNSTVTIDGNVMFPNTVSYETGHKASYYIDLAGGYGIRAKKRKAFVIYANGSGQRAKKATIEPGCRVFVPTKQDPNTAATAMWLSIGTSTATIAALIINALN